MFATLPMYGDGNISTTLDGGRCAVLTGDAIPRIGGPWAHDTITVISGGGAHVVRPAHANTPSPYQAVPDRGDGTVDWLGPAFFAGGTLYSFAPKIRPLAEGWDNLGVNIAVFDVPAGGDPRFSGFLPTATDIAGPVYWDGGVYYDPGSRYVYIFGASVAATDGWTGHDVYAARVRLDNLASPSAWTYLGSGSWTPVQAAAKPILRSSVNGGTETVFAVWRDSHGWNITSKRGGQWGPGQIVRWSTTALGGEWTETVLATIPGDNYIHYEHWALPVTGARQHLFTYNTVGHDATWLAVPRP
jgi:hypothetical protein